MSPEDDAQLTAFCQEIYPELVAGLRFRLNDVGAAEDAAQEALVRVWLKWGHRNQIKDLHAWTWRVALNLSSSDRRRAKARMRVLYRFSRDNSLNRGAYCDPDGHPDDAAAQLESLTERQREVIVLRVFASLSTREVAERLGLSEGTIKATLHQALAAVRKKIQPTRETASTDKRHGEGALC